MSCLSSRSFASSPRLVSVSSARSRRHPTVRAMTGATTATNDFEVTQVDRDFIRMALRLAETAKGKTHPNPCVGCVLVKDGKIIGQGYHPKAGMPHAEVYALRAAGTEAEGATAYVTLEPCNHFGRTPPCSRALVAAGVKKVVVGIVDPNPLVGGFGIQTLRKAGIQVATVGGEEERMCDAVNEEFMARMKAEAAKQAAAE